MSNELLKMVATIKGVSVTDTQIRLDTDRGMFSFFKTKQDGTETAAFATLKALHVKAGSAVGISYKVNGKYKNVMKFEDAKSIEYQAQNLPDNTNEVKGMVRTHLVSSMIKAGWTLERAKLEIRDWTELVMKGNSIPTRDEVAEANEELDAVLSNNDELDYNEA